ncbi:glycoside-pentoside-hexuronide (GPH):cation symporter, partial [Klebsiella pneumoniae]|nr:glycoside-pentoside-hexuronide (GPH):cation symporter [Klebsiella pneumoniae]
MLAEEKIDSISAGNANSLGINNKLSLKAKLSYGLGDMASNLCLALTSTYLMFFYTDIYLLPVAALGTIFLISRIISAAFDPVMGYMIDKTNTKYGRARPYILWFCVPLALLTVLIFTTPELSPFGKICFAFIVYILWGLVYSMVNIPYGTMMSLMTHDSNEKMQLGSLRMLGMSFGQAIVTVSMVPLVNKIGGGNDKIGYLGAAITFSVAMLVLFFIVFFNCKEKIGATHAHVSDQNKKDIRTKTSEALVGLKEICKNTPWLVSVAIALTSFVRFGAMIPITIYFCNYYLKEPKLASIILPLTSLAPAVSALIAPTYFKKLGIRLGNTYAIILGIIFYLLTGQFEHNRMIFMVIYTISMVLSM